MQRRAELRRARRERRERVNREVELWAPRDRELEMARHSGEVAEAVHAAEDGELVPVDLRDEREPAGFRAVLAAKTAERRPILPGWIADTAELRHAVRWLSGHVAHTIAYHLVRVPKYVTRVAARVPVGAWRVFADVSRWAGDAEGSPLRSGAVHANDPEMYMKLSRQRLERIRWRTILLITAAVLAAVGMVSLALVPGWARVLTVATVTAGLAWRGASPDRPLIDRAVVPHRVEKLTSEHIVRALGALGIAEINQASPKAATGSPSPPPSPATAPAGARKATCPSASPSPTSWTAATASPPACAGRSAACGRRPCRRRTPGVWCCGSGTRTCPRPGSPWPLAKAGGVDLFKPAPFGTDQRGRSVDVTLMYISGIIGAIPRMGKTFLLRLLLWSQPWTRARSCTCTT